MNEAAKASIKAKRWSSFVVALRAASPATLIGLVANLCLVTGVLEQLHVLHRARTVNEQRGDARALLVAQTAMLHRLARGEQDEPVEVAGATARVSVREDAIAVTVADPDSSQILVSQNLAGGTSPAFANARTAVAQATALAIGGAAAAPERWPQLDRSVLATAEQATETYGFRRDSEIALRHLSTGTDRPDFVWTATALRRTRHPSRSVLVVPGNLWIAGKSRFVLDLVDDLTVVVNGNVYLLASVHVRGPGRLLLATDTGSDPVVFADVDGSGGWSRPDRLHRGTSFSGAIEGSGSVYLALPGGAPALTCDAGLVVSGELHVATRADVRGPLLVRFGCTLLATDSPRNPALLPATAPTAIPPGAGERPSGHWVFAAGRDAVPGFTVTGPPRPSRLKIRSR